MEKKIQTTNQIDRYIYIYFYTTLYHYIFMGIFLRFPMFSQGKLPWSFIMAWRQVDFPATPWPLRAPASIGYRLHVEIL